MFVNAKILIDDCAHNGGEYFLQRKFKFLIQFQNYPKLLVVEENQIQNKLIK